MHYQDSVTKGLTYRRLTNFADYAGWLENYFHPSVKTETKRLFKFRRPNRPMDVELEYKSFDSDQLNIILKAIDSGNQDRIWISDYITYRNELIIYLFLYLGCRKGELLNLKITDLIHQQGTPYITIKRNPHDSNDSRLYQPLVKTRSRSIGLNQNLQKKLENYILNYRSTLPNAELTDYLILSNTGQPLSINALNKMFTEISRTVSFNVYAHAFRHTWNDKYSEKTQVLISSGESTEAQVENNRAYLMGWIPNSQSARRYSKRAENKLAVEVGLHIQKKFEEDYE